MGLRRHRSIQNLTAFLQRIFNPAEHDEGILFVSTGPTDYHVPAEDFEDALQKAVSDHLSLETIWQVRNTSPAARLGNPHNCSGAFRGAPWALIVRGQHLSRLSRLHHDVNAVLESINLPNSPIQPTSVHSEVKHYRLVQRFEGRHGSKVKGSCIVAVSILPAEGQESDVEQWYRTESLAALATTAPFIRSTRYIQIPDPTREGAPGSRPRVLALHEYTSSKALMEHAMQHRTGSEVTPWSKRIFATAIAVERTIWDIIDQHPSREMQVERL